MLREFLFFLKSLILLEKFEKYINCHALWIEIMGKLFKIGILAAILCFMAFAAANTYCPQESCNGISFLGNYIGTGSSSFTPMYITATPYTSKSLDVTLFNPVAGDVNDDGLNEYILIPSLTTVAMYNTYGNLAGTITLANNIVSPPVLIDYNFDGKLDIAILTNSTLEIYNGTGSGNLLKSFSYYGNVGGSLKNMGCDNYYCFAKNATTNGTAIIRLLCDHTSCYADFNITAYPNSLPASSSIELPSSNGITVYSDIANKYSYSGFWCQARLGSLTQGQCTRQRSDGTLYQYAIAGGSNNIQSFQYVQTVFGKTGSIVKVYLTALYNKTAGVTDGAVLTLTNSSVLFDESAQLCGSAECTLASDNYFTNWMVGQFDKTSAIQSCIVMPAFNRTVCYANGYFGTTSYNYTNAAYPVNRTSLMFMIDYNASEPYMGFATSEGLYYARPDGSTKSLARTGFNNYYSTSTNNRQPLISVLTLPVTSVMPVFHFAGSPTVLYADSIKSSLLSQAFGGLCNNGVCDEGELFSCPTDCAATSMTYAVACSIDAQCPDAFPKCIGGKCVTGFSGIPCADSSVCPFNASVCYNGYCIAGVSGGFITPVNGTPELSADVPIGVQIDNMFAYLFQGSTILRFIAGLFLLLWVTLEINKKYNPDNRSLAVLIIIFAVALIAFTTINLLNKWIVYAIVFISLTLALIFFVLKFKSSASDG
jgi:hypothetical protein